MATNNNQAKRTGTNPVTVNKNNAKKGTNKSANVQRNKSTSKSGSRSKKRKKSSLSGGAIFGIMVASIAFLLALYFVLSEGSSILSGSSDVTVSVDANEDSDEEYNVSSLSYTTLESTEEYDVSAVFDTDGSILSTVDSSINAIYLNGDTAEYTGSNISVSGSTVTITDAGTYYISGTLDDGSIVIDTDADADVILVLNGVSITCSNSAAIYCSQCSMLIINLVEGTTSTLTDGDSYEYESEDTDEPNACLYCDDDLTINGSGSLVVNGNYNNGIVAKDTLKIYNGNITVYAVNNAIKGKDAIMISGGVTEVESDGDGIKSDNDTDTSKGYVIIEGGVVTIDAEEDGISAETTVKITGGTVNITTGDGSSTTSSGSSNWGWSTSSSSTVSKKGIKATYLIVIEGGEITIDSEDDSIHSNGSVDITDGTLEISSGDDGIHGDTRLTISGGEINVTKSYEGLEASTINIDGGTTYVVASDDGLNSAGGSDSSSTSGRTGMNSFSSSTGTLNITGGYLYVNATGDGLDSNGSIYMTGGEVYVDGPTDSGNGTIDYGDSSSDTFALSGGTLVAVGSTGMAQSATATGSAYSVEVYFGSTNSSGSVITIKDSDGNTVLEYTAAKSFAWGNFVLSEFESGETYTIYVDGSEIDDFKLSDNNVTVGSGSSMGSFGRR